ncbi:MAG: type II secretion system protein GspM, partial [Gallionella sp.]
MKLLITKLQLSVNAFWSVRDARERKLLLIAAAFIVVVLYYLLLIAPALAGREKLKLALPQLHEQVAQMQAMSVAATSLSSQAQTTVPTMSKETLSNSMSAHGLSASGVSMVGDSAQVQLNNVSFAQTLAWLDELQKTARVSVSEAKFGALTKPDQVDAT